MDVIQLHKRVDTFTKLNYTSKNRGIRSEMVQTYQSKNGYLVNETLYLPMSCADIVLEKRADLLLIIDDIYLDESLLRNKEQFVGKRPLNNSLKATYNMAHFVLNQLNTPKSIEMFTLKNISVGVYEVWVNFGSFSYLTPKKDSHKICELAVKKPVRYKTNGKADFTLTGRKQRTYYEFDYIFEYLGMANEFVFVDDVKIIKTKNLPLANLKLIDERHILY